MISYCFRVFFVLIPAMGLSQIVDEVLVQPSINVSFHNDSRWSFNTALEQRNVVANEYDNLHVQLSQFASYEIGFYSQIGMGVMYREVFDRDRPEELRTTQQYVRTRNFNSLKIAHRVRWDQRWRGDLLTHRWRYQFSGAIPLNGNVTDASEFYLTSAAEIVFIAENNERPAYDQRVSIGLGKQLNSDYKLQLTTEYRWEDFTAASDRLLFVNLALYYSL